MTISQWLTTWQFVPLVSGTLVFLAGLYLTGAAAVARRHPVRPWPRKRTLAFLGGLAVVAVAVQGSDGVYDDVLLRAHMVQHLLLIMAAPPLLVYGRPATLLLHAARGNWHRAAIRVVRSRAAAALTWPPLTVALYSLVVLGTHLTPLILARGWLHDAEHLAYLVAGYLFFLPVVGAEPIRWRPSRFYRYVLLLAAMPADIVVGAAYMVAGPFGRYSAADVHGAGLIMLAGSELVMASLAMLIAVGLVRSPSGSDGRTRGASTLEEYNARLAGLASAGSPSRRPRGGATKYLS